MANTHVGEKLNVTRYCGAAELVSPQANRSRFQIIKNDGKEIDLSYREAQELLLLLQASMIGWRGEL